MLQKIISLNKKNGCRWNCFGKFGSMFIIRPYYRNQRTQLNLMGYFIRNLFVYGAIALVVWMLYAAIKGMKNKNQQ
ncbi:MAG: hypothetical protein ACI9TK_000024 [Flavobacteriaceae bacterium]|jgi:hypothetical protein|tara:strand:+ start:1731 stop:1958 length:228 start_codon:yes stop_codon:yes gene_type:complete